MKPEDVKRIKELSEIDILNKQGCDHGYLYGGVRGIADDDTMALIKELEEILSRYIGGFRKFANFTHSGENKSLRYMLNYNHGTGGLPFEGVDYIKLSSLYDFKEIRDAKY